MNLEQFTKEMQEYLEEGGTSIQAVIIATDGNNTAIINYGTDDMRVKMIAQYITEETTEFNDKVSELIESQY